MFGQISGKHFLLLGVCFGVSVFCSRWVYRRCGGKYCFQHQGTIPIQLHSHASLSSYEMLEWLSNTKRKIKIYIYISQTDPQTYTRCPRRNVPDFGRVFLMLNYTDITKNTYVQSWTVTEIKAREKCGLLAVPRTLPGSRDVIPYAAHCPSLSTGGSYAFLAATAHVKCLVTLRTTMTWVRVFL